MLTEPIGTAEPKLKTRDITSLQYIVDGVYHKLSYLKLMRPLKLLHDRNMQNENITITKSSNGSCNDSQCSAREQVGDSLQQNSKQGVLLSDSEMVPHYGPETQFLLISCSQYPKQYSVTFYRSNFLPNLHINATQNCF